METQEIINALKSNVDLRNYVLLELLRDDTISIAELVKYKETAMKETLNKNKEDLSNASALLVRYFDKINTSTLEKEARSFVNEQGFFKVEEGE